MYDGSAISSGRRRPNWHEYFMYESSTPERDAFLKQAVQDTGIEVCERLGISPGTYDYILSNFRQITCKRRTSATSFLAS